MISDQQENTNTKKSFISIYQANDQSLFVYSLVVLCHGACVQSKINVCIHTMESENQYHYNPHKAPFRVGCFVVFFSSSSLKT